MTTIERTRIEILAKNLYAEMKKQEFGSNDIMSFSAELIELVAGCKIQVTADQDQYCSRRDDRYAVFSWKRYERIWRNGLRI